MKFGLKRPCAKCPFRSDEPGYLTAGRVREIVRAITAQDQTFACHKTVDYSGDEDGEDNAGEGLVTRDSQHCAGALIFLEHQGRSNQMMRIAERLGLYDRTTLHMDAPVFDSAADMAKHHGGRRGHEKTP